MIKVIEGYKVKSGEDIHPVLLKIRSQIVQYPGFVGAENFVDTKDGSIIAVVSTWQGVECWEVWEKSRMRQALLGQTEELLAEEPRITIYRIQPTTSWGH